MKPALRSALADSLTFAKAMLHDLERVHAERVTERGALDIRIAKLQMSIDRQTNLVASLEAATRKEH